jgi:hypothetical protein
MRFWRLGWLVGFAVAGCWHARPPESPIEVSRFEDTLVYFGHLTPEGLAQLKAVDNGTAHTLLIRSGGGAVITGMEFGEWVHARQLDVVVVDRCASSCANYVFPAGKTKWILPGGVVAWHGSAMDADALPQVEQLPADERPRGREYVLAARAMQKIFFEQIAVNECITRIGWKFGANGFFAMSVEDMQRFGVTNVVMGPKTDDDVKPQERSDLRLHFVHVPSSADLRACD